MIKNKNIYIVLIVITLLVLRFSYILKSPLYLDEGIYISWADLIHNSKDLAYISLQDGKTPLFFWILSILGTQLHNYLLAGRLISIFAGLLTAICWMLIIYKYFDFKKSIIYLLLFLIAPYGFLVERMALSDSLLIAIASLSLMFFTLSKNILDSKVKRKISIFFLFMIFSGIFLGFSYATKTTTRLFYIAYLAIAFSWTFSFLAKKNFKNIIIILLGVIIFTLFYQEIISYFRIGGKIYWSSIAEKEKLMIYSPQEIYTRLISNPLSAFNYSNLFIQYLKTYLSGLLIFIIIGTIRIIYDKKYRKFLWLIFYCIFVSSAICLSGKVMASRYIYSIYPTLLAIAVFGVDYLLSLKNKYINVFVLILMLFVLKESCLYVFDFQKAPYAIDDQEYFVSGNLTALGLPETINYFNNKDKSKVLIGISGTWGVSDGSLVLFKEANIRSEILNTNRIISSKSIENDKCEKPWIQKNDLCWKLEFFDEHDSNTTRYLYIVGSDQTVKQLIDLGVKQIYQFDRFKGKTKNYFLEIPKSLAISSSSL